MTIYEYIDNVLDYTPEKYVSDLKNELETDKEIPEIQKIQWQKGQDSKGKIIGTYSQKTEEITGGRKQAGTPYTLFDTGDFYDKTGILVNEKDNDLFYHLDSESPHKKELFDFFDSNSTAISDFDPEDIFGIQEDNADLVTDIVQNKCGDLLTKNLKL